MASPRPGPDSDPDVVIFASADGSLDGALEAARALLARPDWSRLRAAREGRVYVADGDAARGRPGPQVAESLEAFAEILHPAAFRFGHEGRTWARVGGAAPDGA